MPTTNIDTRCSAKGNKRGLQILIQFLGFLTFLAICSSNHQTTHSVAESMNLGLTKLGKLHLKK